MHIAILLFDKITALDAIGPYEVLSRIPGAEVTFVAREAGPQRADTGFLTLVADAALDDVPAPDVLVVPGGEGNRALHDDDEVIAWIQRAHRTTRHTASVCTGSLVLGRAGLLAGARATTHWAYLERLADYGAEPVAERVVEHGRLITSAGVSAGIDMALLLAARIASDDVARAIQLGIEYDPQPPFDAGSPKTASTELVTLLRGWESQHSAV